MDEACFPHSNYEGRNEFKALEKGKLLNAIGKRQAVQFHYRPRNSADIQQPPMQIRERQ